MRLIGIAQLERDLSPVRRAGTCPGEPRLKSRQPRIELRRDAHAFPKQTGVLSEDAGSECELLHSNPTPALRDRRGQGRHAGDVAWAVFDWSFSATRADGQPFMSMGWRATCIREWTAAGLS
jgi:hypothetical protein